MDRVVELVSGAALILGVLMDVFKSVVLPRPSPQRWRASRMMIVAGWRIWRWIGLRQRSAERREAFLGSFAPFLVLATLAVGIAGLILGYALMLYAIREQIQPEPQTFGTAAYFSALSLLTLGFGDIVPVGTAARVLVVVEAATGLAVVALVISFLFSLYGSFQKREVAIVSLEAVAGAPPSGLAILEAHRKLGVMDGLGPLFDEWRQWSAEVLESHLAYPILGYFRSSHDDQSWVSALGAVLDAATLVVTTVEDGPKGQAKMVLQVGGHLVEDLARFFRLATFEDPGVERAEFDQARRRLQAKGYKLREADAAWAAFAGLRSAYAGPLNEMATWWTTPPAQWIGDRSSVGHRRRVGWPVALPAPVVIGQQQADDGLAVSDRA